MHSSFSGYYVESGGSCKWRWRQTHDWRISGRWLTNVKRLGNNILFLKDIKLYLIYFWGGFRSPSCKRPCYRQQNLVSFEFIDCISCVVKGTECGLSDFKCKPWLERLKIFKNCYILAVSSLKKPVKVASTTSSGPATTEILKAIEQRSQATRKDDEDPSAGEEKTVSFWILFLNK